MTPSSPSPELETRTFHVGHVRVTQVMETTMERPLSLLFPDATAEHWEPLLWLWPDAMTESNEARFVVKTYVLESQGKVVVVDTGYGDDKIRHHYKTGHQLKTGFLERLVAAGFPPETVDIVVSTHLHVDHVGWNTRLVGDTWVPTFPSARYLMNGPELDHWANVGGATGTSAGDQALVYLDSVQPLIDGGLVDQVSTSHRITPEIELVPTPGHTPGHSCVRIASGEEEAWILGDLSHHPIQVRFPELCSNGDVDQQGSLASRHEAWERLTDNNILVLAPHWPIDAAVIVSDADGRRIERR